MFDSIKSLIGFGSSSILGVDIGTASIKIVEIVKKFPKPKLKNYGILKTYGHLERANSAIQTNTLKIVEKETATLLKSLIDKAKFKTREAVASIPSFAAFITLLELPIMPDADIAKTMSFQIKQYVPLPMSEVAIDWLKVGEREDKEGIKQQILLISVPNEIIQRYQNIFKLAGLKLKSLEIESLSLVRSLVGNDPTPTLIVDIGARSSNISIIEKGFLKNNISSDFAGASLTSAIANGLGIDIKRAERLKIQKGLKAGGAEYELSTLPLPYLDAIIGEVVRAKNNFEKNQERKIERILLSGGGANLSGIEEYFEKQINLPIGIGNSLMRLSYPSEIELLAKELGPEFAVAIGLAIK